MVYFPALSGTWLVKRERVREAPPRIHYHRLAQGFAVFQSAIKAPASAVVVLADGRIQLHIFRFIQIYIVSFKQLLGQKFS